MARRLKDLTTLPSVEEIDSLVVVTETDTNLLSVENLRTVLFTKASPSVLGVIKVGANLTIDANGVLSAEQSKIPSQTGNSGKYLTTNGTTVSWSTLTIPSSLPSQTGNAGKYLKTNGVTVTWEPIPVREELPTKTSNSGKFLSNDGTNLIWAAKNVFPSTTSSARDALNAVAGTVVWNTDDTKLQVYTGSNWVNLH